MFSGPVPGVSKLFDFDLESTLGVESARVRRSIELARRRCHCLTLTLIICYNSPSPSGAFRCGQSWSQCCARI